MGKHLLIVNNVNSAHINKFLNNNWILLKLLEKFIKIYVRQVFVSVWQNFAFSRHHVCQVLKILFAVLLYVLYGFRVPVRNGFFYLSNLNFTENHKVLKASRSHGWVWLLLKLRIKLNALSNLRQQFLSSHSSTLEFSAYRMLFLTSDLYSFKSRINRQLWTVGSFQIDFLYVLIFLWFFFL